MYTIKMGDRQTLVIAGIGLLIAQLILCYLGLGSRTVVKSFFWFLKNRYKLNVYLCIISVLITREIYGSVIDVNRQRPSWKLLLFPFMENFEWLIKSNIPSCLHIFINKRPANRHELPLLLKQIV